jgi:hypothetical protein
LFFIYLARAKSSLFNLQKSSPMEEANISELQDPVSREAGGDAEKSSHITTSSPPAESAPAEDWFAWLQVLGAFSLNR